MKLRITLTALLISSVALITPKDALAVIQNLNSQTGQSQSFQNDANVAISSSNDIHSIIWQGLLPISRGGTGASSFTNGSVPFIYGDVFSEDNSNFFWDNANKRLGIGTTAPSAALEVTSDSIINGLTVGLGGGSAATNTSLGYAALLNANPDSSGNTAVGYRALGNAGSIIDSTAVGHYALFNSTTGGGNTAVGNEALRSNTTGNWNTAVGEHALHNTTTGEKNVGMGLSALRNNTTGSNNIGIGFRSGMYQADWSPLTSSANNIYIGYQVKGYDNNDLNSVVIGAEAIGAGANTTVIGSSTMTDVYFGSSDGNADVHAKRLFLGSSSTPGCIIMGDSDGEGVTYLTVDNGVLTTSTTPPSACQ